MEKKSAFKQAVADFIATPQIAVQARNVEIPLDVPKIVSLIGARRTGKTYILYYTIAELRKNVPPNRIVYINFEDDRFFPLQLSDMDLLLQAYYEMYPQNSTEKVWFFFDEIQEVPNWEKFIRRLNDTKNCRIYLTGSSSKMLSRELSTALRGRTLPFEVFPLEFSEFLNFNNIKISNPNSSADNALALHWFDRWLAQGGFPELVFLPEHLHRQTINEYLDLMLYRDLTERFSIRQPALLKYLLKYFLQNLANPCSLRKVFNDLKSQGYSTSLNTVMDYISYMEEAFLLFKVNRWHRSVRVQANNPSKYYVLDPALKYTMSINKDIGRVLENQVLLSLRREGHNPHYLLEKQEVDFYYSEGEPINVCWDLSSANTEQREIDGMNEAMQFLNLKKGVILTRDVEKTVKSTDRTIDFMPAWKYMLY